MVTPARSLTTRRVGRPRRGWRMVLVVWFLLIAVLGVVPVGPVPMGSAPVGAAEPSPTVTAPVCGPEGAMIVRLYRAYFNRVPDPEGLAYWGQVYLATDITNVAGAMAQSEEYLRTWSGVSDRDYVIGLLYTNLLRRPADAEGLAWWMQHLAADGRVHQVIYWIQSPEFDQVHPVRPPASCGTNGVQWTTIKGLSRGTLTMAEVDTRVATIETSRRRCAVASINGNWFGAGGQPIGLAVIGGLRWPGSVDGDDRGIIGAYRRPNGPVPDEVYAWDNAVLSTTLVYNNGLAIEVERDWQRADIAPLHDVNEWQWAASGMTLMIRGQRTLDPHAIDRDPYTLATLRHSVVAFRPPHTISIGSTTTMNALEMMETLAARGYTTVVKMDGGGSVELNRNGSVVVGGTNRVLPVWIGVGC